MINDWHNPAWLFKRYIVQSLTITAIAEEAGVSRTAIRKALARHGFLMPEQAPAPTHSRDLCTITCPFWEDCLDWQSDKPCPLQQKKGDPKC